MMIIMINIDYDDQYWLWRSKEWQIPWLQWKERLIRKHSIECTIDHKSSSIDAKSMVLLFENQYHSIDASIDASIHIDRGFKIYGSIHNRRHIDR